MQAAWGKQEETELLHITAPLRAGTVLAACHINLPSSLPAVWALWRASAKTALTASAGNAPANELRNTRQGGSADDYFHTWVWWFLSFFHAGIFDNLLVVNFQTLRCTDLLRFPFGGILFHCVLDLKWASGILQEGGGVISRKKKRNSWMLTYIESDNVAKSVNEILIRTFVQHMPQQLFIQQEEYFDWEALPKSHPVPDGLYSISGGMPWTWIARQGNENSF